MVAEASGLRVLRSPRPFFANRRAVIPSAAMNLLNDSTDRFPADSWWRMDGIAAEGVIGCTFADSSLRSE
jgi:hypothetical protein